MTSQSDKATFTVAELAEHWSCTADHIRALIETGALPAFDVSVPLASRRRWLIRAADVDAFEAARQHKQPPDTAAVRRARKRLRQQFGVKSYIT